jgi:hypothetical protein
MWNGPSFPPHSSQFPSLIPIHVPEVEQQNEKKETNIGEDEEEEQDLYTSHLRSHVLFRSFLPVSPFLCLLALFIGS